MTLDEMYNKYDNLRDEMKSLDEIILAEERRLRATVSITERKASKILTSENGLQIVVGKRNSTHYEKTVSWYKNGKKAEAISTHDRSGINFWRLWLASEDQK